MISPIVINVNKPTRVVIKSLSSSPCCFNVFIMLLVYEKVRVIVKLKAHLFIVVPWRRGVSSWFGVDVWDIVVLS